ncbi:MAG TPA: nicotinate-nicotinamide nucleotide adenylyltransferase, partial [Micavibrio sp.]
RMLATTIEQDLGTVRSYDTLRALRGRFSATDFVFLMGSDNALQFHQWHRWRDIPDLTALGILGRPPAQQNIRHSPLRLLPLTHRTLSRAETVPLTPQSCYWICGHPLNPLSSTLLRNNN